MPTVEELKEQAELGKPICIIPAKGGSKRLPHKNKLCINGKPLYKYAIDTAKDAKLFDAIIVSSDDEEILEGAYESEVVVHKRPDALAGSDSQIKHTIKYIAGVYKFPAVFCLLTPCNPLRTAQDLVEGYKLFRDKEANYVMSVVQDRPVELSLKLKNGMIEPRKELLQAQKYKPVYRHDGNFIFARSEIFFIEFEWGFYGSKNYPYVVKHPTVDIDTESDFRYAEYLMNRTELENV